ncbi:MAG: methyltransferase domain-containing protein [Methanosarcinales archaeon]|nr:methyltransferase domain-containing protein [Methanosarcinales archaeon]
MISIQPIVRYFEKTIVYFPAFLRWYMGNFKEIVKREIDLANINKSDSVLHIGSGSVPYTAIHVNQMTDASVVSIDIDSSALKLSKRAIKASKFKGNVVLKKGNGTIFPLEQFTVIIISLHAQPKKEILEHIWSNGKKDVRIVIRNPCQAYKDKYDEGIEPFSCIKKVTQPMVTFKHSTLLARSEN